MKQTPNALRVECNVIDSEDLKVIEGSTKPSKEEEKDFIESHIIRKINPQDDRRSE